MELKSRLDQVGWCRPLLTWGGSRELIGVLQSRSDTFVPRPGILARPQAHLTRLEADARRGLADVAGLTSLSVRCLSSYLNFSASFSDMQAGQARREKHSGESPD